jgi:predicted RNA binding protein YcfA (HicA-like mRNA interferase family)
MPRLPRITGEAALRALRAAGWQEVRRRGSHIILHHADRPGRVTIPVHAGVTLKPKTLLSILDQAGVSVDELVNLL